MAENKDQQHRGGWWLIWIPGSVVAAILGVLGFHGGNNNPTPAQRDQAAIQASWDCQVRAMEGGAGPLTAQRLCSR